MANPGSEQANVVIEVNDVNNDDVIDPIVANPEMVDADPLNIDIMNVPQKALDFLNKLKIPMGMEVAHSDPEHVEDAVLVPDNVGIAMLST